MKLPPRHPILYILTLVIFPLIALAMIEKADARHLDTPYGVSPRLLQNCESKWVGTEYHPLPTCTKVWGMLTRETLLSESDYFFTLESNAETIPKR